MSIPAGSPGIRFSHCWRWRASGYSRDVDIGVIPQDLPELLDLDAVQALEDTLSGWNGTAVVASHDRWLINHWLGKHLYLESWQF